jgi:replicative DNA helicase
MNQDDTTTPFPHSIIAEKSVVSAIFGDPDLMAEAPYLNDDHFHLPGPRVIFQVLQHFIAHGKPMDAKCLLQHLLDKSLLQRVGGPSEVADLLRFDNNPARFLFHINTLNDKLARRMAIMAAETIRVAAYEAEDTSELVEATSAPISAIHDTLLALRPADTMKMVMSEVIADLNAKMSGERSSIGIRTNIPCIDHKLMGLHPGRTTIISGYPSGGKSVLGGQLCAEAFMQGKQT